MPSSSLPRVSAPAAALLLLLLLALAAPGEGARGVPPLACDKPGGDDYGVACAARGPCTDFVVAPRAARGARPRRDGACAVREGLRLEYSSSSPITVLRLDLLLRGLPSYE